MPKKQKQWVYGVVYTVTGPSGREKQMWFHERLGGYYVFKPIKRVRKKVAP